MSLHVGQQVEQYRVEAVLRRSGEDASAPATRWVAVDPVLQQRVVLRQVELDPELTGEKLDAAADRLRKLTESHPALVRMLGLIRPTDEDGHAYLVTEQLKAKDVQGVLEEARGPVQPIHVLKMLHAAAVPLEVVHRRGHVHRSLTPGKLLLPILGEKDAKRSGVVLDDAGTIDLLAAGQPLAEDAAPYTAPELFDPAAKADGRADLYSLGMIAYELLAGRPAFEEAFKALFRDKRNAAVRWMKWHRNERLTPPPLTEVNHKVPARLADLVDRLLAKDPNHRPRSAHELRQAIARNFTPEQARAAGMTAEEIAAAEAEAARPSPGAAALNTPCEGAAPARDTATLHRRKWWPYVTAAVVLLAAVLGVAGYAALEQMEQRRVVLGLVERAQQQREAADAMYAAGEFSEAASTYAAVLEIAPDAAGAGYQSTEGFRRHARLGLLLSEARAAILDSRYAEARESLLKADAIADDNRDAVQTLLRDVDARLAVGADLEAVEAAIENGQYAAARRVLDTYRGQTLGEAERTRVDELRARLEGQVIQQLAREAGERAEEHAQAGRVEDAIETLEQAYERYRTPGLEAALTSRRKQRDFAAAFTNAQAFDKRNKLGEAIKAYEEALAIDPEHAATAGRIRELKARRQVERGQKFLERGETERARISFTEALGFDPNDAAARGYLLRMEAMSNRQQRVDAGETALQAGELEAAIEHFRQALTMSGGGGSSGGGDVSDIEQKLREARLRWAMERGNRAYNAGDLAAAAAAYGEARVLAPDDPEVTEAVEQVDRRGRYDELLANGDRLREQSRYVDAKRAYQQAAEVDDTPAVRQRMDEVEYEHLVAQAKGFLAAGRADAARAKLISAQRLNDSEQVRQLMQEVERAS